MNTLDKKASFNPSNNFGTAVFMLLTLNSLNARNMPKKVKKIPIEVRYVDALFDNDFKKLFFEFIFA